MPELEENQKATYVRVRMEQPERAENAARVRVLEPSRWDAFPPWELAALDEFFQNFARLRDYSADIQKMKDEIRANMERRQIKPYWGKPDACKA